MSEEFLHPLPAGFSKRDLELLLIHCVDKGASDVTISSGDFVYAKIKRIIYRVTERKLDSSEMEMFLAFMRGPEAVGILGKGMALDWPLEVPLSREVTYRFRANATACRVNGIMSGMSVTLRAIPGLPPKLTDLGIEPEIVEALFPRYGLVLVVGTTNSGKSTLLASASRYRTEERQNDPVKIITYEDPIEFTFDGLGGGVMPEISQVQIGTHLRAFHGDGDLQRASAMEAGRNANRRGADVIIMGEVRDRETADSVLELARTGHSTYATLHTETPSQTMDRLLSFFPYDRQAAIGSQLLASLRLVVAQKLCPGTDGKVRAYRSWVVFTREIIDELSEMPVANWARHVRQINRRNKNDFESIAFDDFVKGKISVSTYRDLTSFTRNELVAFARERGFDVSHMA